MTEEAGVCLNGCGPRRSRDLTRYPIVERKQMMLVARMSVTLIGETGHTPRNTGRRSRDVGETAMHVSCGVRHRRA